MPRKPAGILINDPDRAHNYIDNLHADVLWKAADIFQDLRKRGEPFGENDPWIAATALFTDQPLVMASSNVFQKIRGLRVLSHSPSA